MTAADNPADAQQAAAPRWDFFISYTAKDRRWAEWIAWHLMQAGRSVILQAWDFLSGENYMERMDAAHRGSRVTVVVYTPAYLRSDFTRLEGFTRLIQDPLGRNRSLQPVRVARWGDQDPDAGLFRGTIYTDLVDLDWVRIIHLPRKPKPLSTP